MIFDSKTVLKATACLFLKISTCSRLDVRLERQASSQECTVAHNCHIKTKCSHQIQITHIKFKSLTSNSNHSQQIQITHSKLKITHSKFKLLIANYKSTTANYKSFTSNTNRSHEIQIAHSKYKSLTASTNTVSVKRGLRTADCGLQTSDCGLQTRGKSRLRVKCRLQTKGKIQNGDRRTRGKMQNEVCRLQTRGKMREKTTRKMFALVEVRRNP